MKWQRATTCKWHTNLSKGELCANETLFWAKGNYVQMKHYSEQRGTMWKWNTILSKGELCANETLFWAKGNYVQMKHYSEQRGTMCKWNTILSKEKLRAYETQTLDLQAHRTCPWRSHECISWHAVSPGTPWWAALEMIERTVPSLCRSKWSHWATVHAWSHCGTGGIPTLRSIATKHTMSRSLPRTPLSQ